jgi:hypothetical protein
MGHCIVKLAGKYLDWSSVVDAPVSYGMTLEEYRAFYLEEYGKQGMKDLDARLKRVEKIGTSSQLGHTPEELVSCNRAGPNEKPLTMKEIIEFYVVRQEEPTKQTLEQFRQDAGAIKCEVCKGTGWDKKADEFCDHCDNGSGYTYPS